MLHEKKTLLALVLLAAGLASCEQAAKKVAKVVTKDILKEAVEEGSEAAAKKSAKLLMKSAGREGAEQGAKQAAKALSREAAEEGAEAAGRKILQEGAEEAVEKSSVSATRSLTRGVIELSESQIPKGRKALEVVWDANSKKYIPAIDNLGNKAAKYGSKTNERLLEARRRAISPYLQFATNNQLEHSAVKAFNPSEAASSSTLLNNMLGVMSPQAKKYANAFGGHAAHHVVEGTDPAAKASREILQKFKIGINDAANGILLPTDANSIYKGALHRTGHTEAYSKYVYSQIKDCKTRSEVIAKLTEIKHHIYDGKINLQGLNQAYNKNTIR